MGQEFLGAMLGVEKEEASVAVWHAEMEPGSVWVLVACGVGL